MGLTSATAVPSSSTLNQIQSQDQNQHLSPNMSNKSESARKSYNKKKNNQMKRKAAGGFGQVGQGNSNGMDWQTEEGFGNGSGGE